MRSIMKTVTAIILCLTLFAPITAPAAQAADETDSLAQVYDKAIELMEQKEFDTAIAIFEMLGDYKDSPAKMTECTIGKKDMYYDSAVALYEKGQYDSAAQVFEIIRGHKDSEVWIVMCQNEKLRIQYDKAAVLAETGNYDDAIFIFELLGDYADSENQIKLIQKKQMDEAYAAAGELMHEGRYAEAAAAFEALDGYADSAKRIEECEQAILSDELIKKIELTLSGLEPAEAYGELVALREENAELLAAAGDDGTLSAIRAIELFLENAGSEANAAALDALKALTPQIVASLEDDNDGLKDFLLGIDDQKLFADCLDDIRSPHTRLEMALAVTELHADWELGLDNIFDEAVYDALGNDDPELALTYIAGMEGLIDEADITNLRADAYNVMAALDLDKFLFADYMDIDSDGEDEMIAAAAEKLAFYELTTDGIERAYDEIEFDAESVSLESAQAGDKYIMLRGTAGELLLLAVTKDGPKETLRVDAADSWEFTGTGIVFHAEYSRSPLRYGDKEFVLIGEKAVETAEEIIVELEGYPVCETALDLFAVYADAINYMIPEEMEYLEAQGDYGASTEALREWILENGEPTDAKIYLWNTESEAYECIVEAGGKSALVLLLPDDEKGFVIGGLIDGEARANALSGEMICLNEEKTGELKFNNEVRDDLRYLIYMPASGGLTVSFKNPFMNNNGTYCTVQLYHAGSDELIWSGAVAGNAEQTVFSKLYLGAGYYYARVYAEMRAESEFGLLIDYEPDEFCEVEPNNVFDSASRIETNRWHAGAVTLNNDIDIYSFTLEEPGKVLLNFKHEYFDNNNTSWRIEIQKTVQPDSVLKISEINGRTDEFASNPFYLAAGDYFIKINPSTWSSRPYTFSLDYEAMENTELEFNNTFDNATVVEMNEEYSGAHSYKEDKDFYSFTLDEPGMVEFMFWHEYFDDGSTYYRIAFYDRPTTNNQLFSVDINGRTSEYAYWPFYLDAGTYYFSVNNSYWTTTPYNFTWNYTPMGNVELESNNTYADATVVTLNEEWNGSLSYDGDIDYYTFTLDEPSEVTIDFGFEYFDNNSTHFRLALDFAANNSQRYLALDINGRDNDIETSKFYLPAGVYYFSVEKYYWTGRTYMFAVNASPNPDIELEWNNTYADATPLALGQSINGSFRYDGDVDIYRLDIEEETDVRVNFKHDWFDNTGRYFVVHLDAQPNNSNRLLTLNVNGTDADVTSEELISLAPGTYYIVVEKYHHYHIPYTLTVSGE